MVLKLGRFNQIDQNSSDTVIFAVCNVLFKTATLANSSEDTVGWQWLMVPYHTAVIMQHILAADLLVCER